MRSDASFPGKLSILNKLFKWKLCFIPNASASGEQVDFVGVTFFVTAVIPFLKPYQSFSFADILGATNKAILSACHCYDEKVPHCL